MIEMLGKKQLLLGAGDLLLPMGLSRILHRWQSVIVMLKCTT